MTTKRKTRRTPGSGTVISLPNGDYQARVDYYVWVPDPGNPKTLIERRRYRTETWPTKAEAERARKRLVEKRDHGMMPVERQ